MPIFAPDVVTGQLEELEIIENEEYGGYQIHGTVVNVDPEAANRQFWLPIPDKGVTSRTVLGKWAVKVAEVDKRIDGLDFRKMEKALKAMFGFLLGGWYAFELQEISWGSGSKEYMVPIRRFKGEEEAAKYDGALKVGEIKAATEGDSIPKEILATAQKTWEQLNKNEEGLRAIAKASWPGIDADELIKLLKAE